MIKWFIIAAAVFLIVFISSIFFEESANEDGWYVKYFKTSKFMPFKVYCDGEWQAAFETLDEAKEYIEERKKIDPTDDDPGKIVYRG